MFIIRRIFRILLRIVIAFLVFSVGLTLVYRWWMVPFTPLMVIRAVEQKDNGEKLTFRRDWVDIEDISKDLQLAVIASEDQNFLTHNGFDWKAIQEAMQENEEGHRLRGGSTISQQTAKNVFLWPGRSYLRKGLEVWFTVLAEFFWSKERIMEIYLNSIEMGKGIYGAEAASQFWFKKPAAALSRDEAAALTAILPNPRKYVANPPGPYIAKRKQWIIRQMRLRGGKLEYDNTNEGGEKKAPRAKKRKTGE